MKAGNNAAVRRTTAVILVEPRYPGNIGSVARAMANTGFDRLILVNPCKTDSLQARKMALGALPILEKAPIFKTLEAALQGFNYAVATTCREGTLRKNNHSPRSLGPLLAKMDPENSTALVFGPEDRGLDNTEVGLCNGVITIPTHPGFRSVNLSHAVMVVLWELWSFQEEETPDREKPVLADVKKVAEMYHHLESVLLDIGYLDPQNPQRMIRALKSIFNRHGLEERDVRIVRGILRQFRWYMRNHSDKKMQC